MSTETNLDVSLWERVTDSLSAMSEGIVGFMGRLFGSSNERIIRSLGYVRPRGTEAHAIVPGSILAQVNALEEEMRALSDEALKAKTTEFRERLQNGETLDDLLPEAFAACRESAWRTKNMRHFDVQIVGGAVLHRGMIAEMVTGEGKTLVATLPAYLNALDHKGVHVVTVNDYLARRDCEWMSPIFLALGVSCGFIQSDMDPVARRRAYDCDVTYGTNSEFGFDYLRDNMNPARWGDPDYPPDAQQCQRNLNFAIIDEVDNILIDEARTPLIISGQAHGNLARYAEANRIAVELTRLEKKAQEKLRAVGHGLNIPGHILSAEGEQSETGIQDKAVTQGIKAGAPPDDDGEADDIDVSKIEFPSEEKKEKRLGYYFEVKEKERTCHLTDEGIRKAEELAGVESFYTAGNMEWPHLIDNSLKAHHLYHKDKQYVVMRHPETNELSVIIVDEFTGRLMVGRQWSDGLHQAVEAKHAREGVKIKEETQTLATVTLQNFFKLYKKLAGMTGTAMTEANEFWKIYKLEVVSIPTNKPLTRVNYPDSVYMTEKEKWEAVVTEIERIHRYDVVHLNDGTDVVGTIKSETDAEITIQPKETRDTQVIKIADIDEIDRPGRPMLVGTTNVNQSEKLSALLKRRGIRHELLNAKPEYAAREAEIVAQAGRTGAVTIATNMAGRGTDVILGGNPEYLAWARLKDQYATLLDVPPDLWKSTVAEMRAKENMVEEGRAVAERGGLHIIGTERHEARRIDNQLRGRAGRQGDPGSSRFFVSLQDELMRVFAGEWVAGVLQRLGMEEGQSIESGMVTRRIEAAQKKVEEHHFDIRKHLLEYDEVMDHQRKKVYGFRQEILDGANSKTRVLAMLTQQIDLALDRYLDESYGPSSFAELVSQQLNIECAADDFVRCSFEEADRVARDKAYHMIQSMILEAMDENLDTETDPQEWNWQAMADRVNKLWDLKTNDRQLKKIGRDNLAEFLIKEAEKVVQEVDLSKGTAYLEPGWGIRSLCTWFDLKFQIRLDPARLDPEKGRAAIRTILLDEVHRLYRQKEIEFPVSVAMARFMHEQGGVAPGQRYNREGLYQWYTLRYGPAGGMTEEEFRTLSRAKLHDMLVEVSRKSFPEATQDDIDAMLQDAFEGTRAAEEADAQEMSEWARTKLNLEIPAAALTGATYEQARDRLWNAYDERYRPEMRRMERSLLLGRLDLAWKNHLLTMDHLRQGIGLVGYAQIDPKTEFKRVGMKEFDAMWEGLSDKATDVIFRMEDDEAFAESVWAIGALVHDTAPSAASFVEAGGIQQEQQQAIAGSQQTDRKAEPIRNRGEKVGRNDPCPCGSGKKYKNCCMRQAVK
jgi:preprotein translocase subunit SecA